MSHFTVIVVGSDIEGQMAPYAEQDFEEKFGIFQDTEDQNLEEYLNKDVDIVVLADGTLHNKYKENFRQYDPNNFSSKYVYPEGSLIRESPRPEGRGFLAGFIH